MSEPANEVARPTDAVGRVLFNLTKALAIFGGVLCCVIAILVTVSVTGRYLFSAPIAGDYDIVGILSGCAIFAFLPYCQLVRGNVMVDFLTAGIGNRAKAVLNAFGTLLYLVIAVLFTWRLYYGMLDLHSTNQVLATVNFYRWWTVPFDIFCMIVLIVVILYTFVRDIGDVSAARLSAASSIKEE
jgi:TRAP-type C4-dicarboxylate transport system permease small subunit